MGWLDKFKGWSERKLRLSQIKILYQNFHAIDDLLPQFETMREAGISSDESVISALLAFREIVEDGISELRWSTVLTERQSQELLQVNSQLKMLYSSVYEGKRAARAAFGGTAGDLQAFADRYKPACGWERFSDNEWDALVSKALKRTNP